MCKHIYTYNHIFISLQKKREKDVISLRSVEVSTRLSSIFMKSSD